MRRLPRVAALLALLMLGALASAGPAGAVPREFYGLVPQGSAPSAADIERMGKGKVGTVRLLINWGTAEPTDDNFKFAALDSYVGNLAAAGIRPFPFVWGAPPFVSSNNLALPVESAAQQAEWTQFLGELVKRYGPGGTYWTSVFPGQHPGAAPMPVKTWQLWNEQNAPKHAKKPSPSKYAQLLKISRPAITGQDPGAEIVMGGMFGKPRGKGALKAWSFLKRLYKTKGVKQAFDGVALHPYSPDLKGIKQQLKKIREVLKKKKDKKADTWITEVGWGSSKKGRLGVGKKKQGSLLKQSFKYLKKKRGKMRIGGVMWYTWRDLSKSAAPCNWCTSAGLFRQTGDKPKSAWKKYVKFTGGS